MKALIASFLTLFCSALMAESANPKPRYLVVPKTVTNPFFDDVEKGCLQAAAELDVECIYLGPEEADARYQDQIITQQIEQGVDGISVSVINSRVLTHRSMLLAKQQKVPVVTFDSDFSEQALAQNPTLRYSYIGTDNFQFGFQLGRLTQALKPKGGAFCILTGHKGAANLVERKNGVYAGLGFNSKGNSELWEEHSRCPIHSDDEALRSLNNLDRMVRLHQYEPKLLDAVITVGAWPQTLEFKYTEIISPYQKMLDSKNLLLIFGDTLEVQKRLLAQGLAHGNVGQSPYDMGYQSIYTLHSIHQGNAVEPIIHTKLERCVYGQQPLCQ
ncbi:substrate-binding domain-containing protein [Agarivorans sp. DSG3-1]|uniref:substrate-binding domain-containing protein n=1 Tax=Agarivorans sp. DSG3-1 TaxID=3342249 RepID=UPI00398EFD37